MHDAFLIPVTAQAALDGGVRRVRVAADLPQDSSKLQLHTLKRLDATRHRLMSICRSPIQHLPPTGHITQNIS